MTFSSGAWIPPFHQGSEGRPKAEEGWRGPVGQVVRTFAIITTAANELIRPIHDRMPLLLEQEDWPVWLGGKVGDAPTLLRLPAENVLRLWQ